MPSLTQSAVPILGIPARRSVLAGGLWPMAILPRCVGRDRLPVVQVVGIAYMESLFTCCISPTAGFCRAGSGSFPIVSRPSNGCGRDCFDRI